MKWTYIIEQKMKAAFALGIVIMLVLFTNLINKNHFSRLHESFVSVYEDRLVVENLIYKISVLLNQKEQLYRSVHQGTLSDILAELKSKNDSISDLIQEYETTYLTEEEIIHFVNLKSNLQELTVRESKVIASKRSDASGDYEIDTLYSSLLQNLRTLSDIQVLEGKRLITNSDKIFASSNMTLKIELAVLVVIGVILQAMVFSSKSTKPKFNQNSSWN